MEKLEALEREEEKLEAERDAKAVKGETGAPKDGVVAEKKAQAALMQSEERNTGSVSGEVYVKYLRYAGR